MSLSHSLRVPSSPLRSSSPNADSVLLSKSAFALFTKIPPLHFPFCVYLVSLTTSLITLTSLYMRGLILIGLITCLLLYISSISTYPYLPCYSLRDPPSNRHILLHQLRAEYSASGMSEKLATIYTSARDQAELSVAGFWGSQASHVQASEKPIKSRRASSKGTRMHSCWKNET